MILLNLITFTCQWNIPNKCLPLCNPKQKHSQHHMHFKQGIQVIWFIKLHQMTARPMENKYLLLFIPENEKHWAKSNRKCSTRPWVNPSSRYQLLSLHHHSDVERVNGCFKQGKQKQRTLYYGTICDKFGDPNEELINHVLTRNCSVKVELLSSSKINATNTHKSLSVIYHFIQFHLPDGLPISAPVKVPDKYSLSNRDQTQWIRGKLDLINDLRVTYRNLHHQNEK